MRFYDQATQRRLLQRERGAASNGAHPRRWYEQAYQAPPHLLDLPFHEPTDGNDCLLRLELAQDSLYHLDQLLRNPPITDQRGRPLRPIDFEQRRQGLLAERSALEAELANLRRWGYALLNRPPAQAVAPVESTADTLLLAIYPHLRDLVEQGRLPFDVAELLEQIRDHLCL